MSIRPHDMKIRRLGWEDVEPAAALLGRGMADNPIHVAVYGGDDSSRARSHGALMRTLLENSPGWSASGVESGDSLVGIAASAPPGSCQPGLPTGLRLFGAALSFGPLTASRLLSWKRAWARHDMDVPHVHLGPVAVDPDMRGRGIGSLLLSRHVEELDRAGAPGYLETDRPQAVTFYQRFGYMIEREVEVLGVPCWFMQRPAA